MDVGSGQQILGTPVGLHVAALHFVHPRLGVLHPRIAEVAQRRNTDRFRLCGKPRQRFGVACAHAACADDTNSDHTVRADWGTGLRLRNRLQIVVRVRSSATRGLTERRRQSRGSRRLAQKIAA